MGIREPAAIVYLDITISRRPSVSWWRVSVWRRASSWPRSWRATPCRRMPRRVVGLLAAAAQQVLLAQVASALLRAYALGVARLERLLAMALFLGSRRRVVARTVAEKFGVSLRTVYRDVSALAEAGFPIEGNAGDGYRLSREAYLRPLALHPDEAEVLAIAAYGYKASADAAQREPLARAITKLEAALDGDARVRLRGLEAKIVVAESARVIAPNVDVLSALRERRLARIRYAPPHAQTTTRTIEPLGLVCRGDAWWLVAYCRLRRGARVFRVDAITAWKTGAEFAAREHFSFDEIIARDRHLGKSLFGY